MLTGPGADDGITTTSGITNGAGGHYISNNQAFPEVNQFCASGFNEIKTNQPSPNDRIRHPHYVLFED